MILRSLGRRDPSARAFEVFLKVSQSVSLLLTSFLLLCLWTSVGALDRPSDAHLRNRTMALTVWTQPGIHPTTLPSLKVGLTRREILRRGEIRRKQARR